MCVSSLKPTSSTVFLQDAPLSLYSSIHEARLFPDTPFVTLSENIPPPPLRSFRVLWYIIGDFYSVLPLCCIKRPSVLVKAPDIQDGSNPRERRQATFVALIGLLLCWRVFSPLSLTPPATSERRESRMLTGEFLPFFVVFLFCFVREPPLSVTVCVTM